MSVEFANLYQEILLDNLMAVIKQNFVFQTQLKIVENTGKELEETKLLLNDIREKYESIKGLAEQAGTYKNIADQTSSLHDEKNRIQEALNSSLAKIKELTAETTEWRTKIHEQNLEVQKLKQYISDLESNVPATKLKKINSHKVSEMQQSNSKETQTKKQLEDGSAF